MKTNTGATASKLYTNTGTVISKLYDNTGAIIYTSAPTVPKDISKLETT
jgi:hypothetical protein